MSDTSFDTSLDPLTVMRSVYYEQFDEYKAELVDGEIHVMSPTGFLPGRAAANIYLSLRAEEARLGGVAVSDNTGFKVDIPGRETFSPDAAFYTGGSRGVRYLDGAPAFAAEVRSEHDYGPRAEQRLARKRDDYFTAGTQVVWDVDLLGPDTVRVYRAASPKAPDVFRVGETAEAEPAVPGWRFPVDELFA